MPVPLLPMLAAGLDWLEGLVPLAVFLLWVLAQVVSFLVRLAGGGEQVAPPRPAGPRPPALPRPPAPRAGAGEREALERQVEEFLGRAGRANASAGRPPRPRTPAPPALSRAGTRPTDIRPLDSGDVARHVHEVFDHGVGQLAPAAVARDERSAAPPATGGIAEVLALVRSPAGIRQILLARELLERPEHRW